MLCYICAIYRSHMFPDFKNKSTLDEIRARFDNDVDRFADLETGQQSTIDAPLSLELVTDAARPIYFPATTELLNLMLRTDR